MFPWYHRPPYLSTALLTIVVFLFGQAIYTLKTIRHSHKPNPFLVNFPIVVHSCIVEAGRVLSWYFVHKISVLSDNFIVFIFTLWIRTSTCVTYRTLFLLIFPIYRWSDELYVNWGQERWYFFFICNTVIFALLFWLLIENIPRMCSSLCKVRVFPLYFLLPEKSRGTRLYRSIPDNWLSVQENHD